jgi:hypothetical protein
MSRRPRRGRAALAAWSAALGVVLLGGGLVVTGMVSATETIPGRPLAQAHVALPADGHDYPALAVTTQKPRATAKKPAVRKPPAVAPAPKPTHRATSAGGHAAGQRPGTIRLPLGGTAALVRAEVGADGTLPIPDGLGEATWWGSGLGAPVGATLFAGHVNWRGKVGPFNELWQDRVGQVVSVADAQRKTWRYRITKVITVGKNELPQRAKEFFGPTGAHRVVLVTCGGRWVGGSDGYASNRIVIATPIK